MSGAGKSTVSRLMEACGFTVIDCDTCAREVAAAGSPFLAELSQRFSGEIINSDGSLNRRKTADIIFAGAESRHLYNRIIYPYITYNVIEKIYRCGGDVLIDAPTLFEARLEGICSEIVSVCADIDVCIRRIMQRDNLSQERAAARLSAQHTADFFRRHSDICIENNGTQQQLEQAAKAAAEQLKR